MEGSPSALRKRKTFHVPDQKGALGKALLKHIQHIVNIT